MVRRALSPVAIPTNSPPSFDNCRPGIGARRAATPEPVVRSDPPGSRDRGPWPGSCGLAVSSRSGRQVFELRVPVTAALRAQVQEMPDRRQQVDPALVDILGQVRMPGVEMPRRARRVQRENRDRGVLVAFGILAAEIVLKGAVPAAGQPQLVPAPGPCCPAVAAAREPDARPAGSRERSRQPRRPGLPGPEGEGALAPGGRQA
jgi:hypothetical protein